MPRLTLFELHFQHLLSLQITLLGRHVLRNLQRHLMTRNYFMNFITFLIGGKTLISGRILIKAQINNKINGCKSFKNPYILMKLYQITHFNNLYVKSNLIFQNIKFLTPREEL